MSRLVPRGTKGQARRPLRRPLEIIAVRRDEREGFRIASLALDTRSDGQVPIYCVSASPVSALGAG